jgi:hypothetical protein
MVLDNEDIIDSSEVDAEILGAGTLMAFTIISPMILLAYAVEGRKVLEQGKLTEGKGSVGLTSSLGYLVSLTNVIIL